MPKKNGNIFSNLSAAKKREVSHIWQKGKGFKIERIVSRGQTTPKDKWLCSKTDEWVMVLRGQARLFFKGKRCKIEMSEGDHVFIPASTRHRVDWTHPRKKTVWLAVHSVPEQL
jgi:cupin 2 domain-containing protein